MRGNAKQCSDVRATPGVYGLRARALFAQFMVEVPFKVGRVAHHRNTIPVRFAESFCNYYCSVSHFLLEFYHQLHRKSYTVYTESYSTITPLPPTER